LPAPSGVEGFGRRAAEEGGRHDDGGE
jgi:hypothetical protein